MKKQNDNRYLTLIAIGSVLLIGAIWSTAYFTLKDEDSVVRGTFGDMFGGVNALFSGLASAGIIITILLQSKELALQRDELKNSREELKRTADAQVRSNQSLEGQVANMRQSAKLSALNTLVIYYGDEIRSKEAYNSAYNAMQASVLKEKRSRYIEQIENILDGKMNLH